MARGGDVIMVSPSLATGGDLLVDGASPATLVYGTPGVTIAEGKAFKVVVDVAVKERVCLMGPGWTIDRHTWYPGRQGT